MRARPPRRTTRSPCGRHANAGSPSPDNALLTAFFRSLLERIHLARLAASNEVLQQSAHTLASSRKALVSARRLISKRRLPPPAPTAPERVRSTSVLPEVRARAAQMRRLLERQIEMRATSAMLLVLLKLRDGSLPRDGGPVFTGKPGSGGRCSACGVPIRRTQLAMSIHDGLELHGQCFMLWNEARQDGRARSA